MGENVKERHYDNFYIRLKILKKKKVIIVKLPFLESNVIVSTVVSVKFSKKSSANKAAQYYFNTGEPSLNDSKNLLQLQATFLRSRSTGINFLT